MIELFFLSHLQKEGLKGNLGSPLYYGGDFRCLGRDLLFMILLGCIVFSHLKIIIPI